MATAEDVMISLNANLDPVMDMLVAGAYVIGMGFVVKGIFKFRKLADLHNQMASGADLSAAVGYIIVGVFLIWSPSIFEASSVTLFGSDQGLLSYKAIGDKYGIWQTTLYHVMQIIGIIAFIRGWMIIASAAEANAQQGTLSKGLTHVVGGVLCFHIVPLFNVLNETLGNPFSGPF